jgi:hypothetical protein
MGCCSYNTRLIEQSSPERKGTLLIAPYAWPANSQYKMRHGVDNEQCGGLRRLALKRDVAGSVSLVWGGLENNRFMMVKMKSLFLRWEGGRLLKGLQ